MDSGMRTVSTKDTQAKDLRMNDHDEYPAILARVQAAGFEPDNVVRVTRALTQLANERIQSTVQDYAETGLDRQEHSREPGHYPAMFSLAFGQEEGTNYYSTTLRRLAREDVRSWSGTITTLIGDDTDVLPWQALEFRFIDGAPGALPEPEPIDNDHDADDDGQNCDCHNCELSRENEDD